MKKKEVKHKLVLMMLLVLSLLLLLSSLLFISGCGKKENIIVCEEPQVIIGQKCCMDADNSTVCDDEEAEVNQTGATLCGNGECEAAAGEDCRNCWQDCGPCKQIVYVYIPRNFTLSELTADLNSITPDTELIKFRKDIYNSDNVTNFFYFSKTIPRYFADFMDVKYKYLKESRWILLNHIINENYYVNDSESLARYLNFTTWYRIHSIKNSERNAYEKRITSEAALKDYPTQPTGYDKEYRYEDWKFRNYTRNERIIYNNITLLDNGLVESRYTSLTQFNVTYRYHTYFTDKYEDDNIILEDFKTINELYLTNIQTINFRCARNLVITLYEYKYDGGYYNINEENLAEQAALNRADLIRRANLIKPFCDRKYANEVFTYT